MTDPVSEFLDAMGAAGIRPVEPIAARLASGDPIRFRADGDRPGRRNGWARLHLDGVPAGVFRHYRLGVRTVWRAGGDPRPLSPAERRTIVARARESEARRKAETVARQEAAARRAADLWRNASRADPAHPYLIAKALEPFGIRQAGRDLLVPMFDCGFRLWNIQRIAPDGEKRFLPGGRVAGLFWWAGKAADRLVIGEGMATMAAVRRATGLPVIAALSAHNLPTVAAMIRARRPDLRIIIAADDDAAGINAARLAAERSGAVIAVPEINQ
jgi:putative DNA primase/helicase